MATGRKENEMTVSALSKKAAKKQAAEDEQKPGDPIMYGWVVPDNPHVRKMTTREKRKHAKMFETP